MLKVDATAVRRALDTWTDQGVICEEVVAPETRYVLVEKAGEIPASSSRPLAPRHGEYLRSPRCRIAYRDNSLAVIEEPVAPVVTPQQQEAEQMRVYWKFIEGMLTNLGALPIDRIQTMLKFAPNYTRTVEQLGIFMEAARREGLVTVNNGLWRLNK